MKSFTIRTKSVEESRIVCRAGILRTTLVRALADYREVFFFSDRNVWELYGRKIGRAYRNSPVHIMPAGEAHKTPETLFKLLAAMAEAQLHRGACLVCLGGGVVGDVGGLAAALYMRGSAAEHLLNAFIYCMLGYFNGRERTTFVMAQGLFTAFLVRIPLSYLLSRLPGAGMLTISMAIPATALVSLVLCTGYLLLLRRRDSAAGAAD